MSVPSDSSLISQNNSQKSVKDDEDGVLPLSANKWYKQLDTMIGSKKDYTNIFAPPLGIPYPEKTPEEKRITAAMESCLFKTTMSCVIGYYNFINIPHLLYYIMFHNLTFIFKYYN